MTLWPNVIGSHARLVPTKGKSLFHTSFTWFLLPPATRSIDQSNKDNGGQHLIKSLKCNDINGIYHYNIKNKDKVITLSLSICKLKKN
ncbi:hypothetical protein BLOT_015431 [Blomia tropicalis]|nr:hypothetical protein BLOT_015431 [Blomia tropicalis]